MNLNFAWWVFLIDHLCQKQGSVGDCSLFFLHSFERFAFVVITLFECKRGVTSSAAWMKLDAQLSGKTWLHYIYMLLLGQQPSVLTKALFCRDRNLGELPAELPVRAHWMLALAIMRKYVVGNGQQRSGCPRGNSGKRHLRFRPNRSRVTAPREKFWSISFVLIEARPGCRPGRRRTVSPEKKVCGAVMRALAPVVRVEPIKHE